MRSLKTRKSHISIGEIVMLQILFGFVTIFLIIWVLIAAVAIVLSVFWIMMLIDCAKREFKDKVVWILIILFAGFIGAILYYYIIKKSKEKKSVTKR